VPLLLNQVVVPDQLRSFGIVAKRGLPGDAAPLPWAAQPLPGERDRRSECPEQERRYGTAQPEGLARLRPTRLDACGLYSTEALAERKRVRELLAQSRELLKQMQAGSTGGFMVYGVHPPDFF
jgi:hypothetical protein